MDAQGVQDETVERIRQEFHAKVERLRGEARDLKVLLERCHSHERHRSDDYFDRSEKNAA